MNNPAPRALGLVGTSRRLVRHDPMSQATRRVAPTGRRRQSGFNLIEVSLAIAICSIGLIALIGLIPTGIDASRRAADDTLATSIASDILHTRRIMPYTNPTYIPPGGAPLNTRTTMTGYFDAMGNTLSNSTEAYFSTTYTVMDHPQFVNASNDVARLLITIEWPASSANSANRTKRVFVSDYARWQ